MRSPKQTTVGKIPQGNGIITSGFTSNHSLGDIYNLQFKEIQEAMKKKEMNTRLLKEDTMKSELTTFASKTTHGQSNNAIQIVTPVIKDPGLLAGKTFSVTSGILAKGILINNRV